jgi:hypothetical protein
VGAGRARCRTAPIGPGGDSPGRVTPDRASCPSAPGRLCEIRRYVTIYSPYRLVAKAGRTYVIDPVPVGTAHFPI